MPSFAKYVTCDKGAHVSPSRHWNAACAANTPHTLARDQSSPVELNCRTAEPSSCLLYTSSATIWTTALQRRRQPSSTRYTPYVTMLELTAPRFASMLSNNSAYLSKAGYLCTWRLENRVWQLSSARESR